MSEYLVYKVPNTTRYSIFPTTMIKVFLSDEGLHVQGESQRDAVKYTDLMVFPSFKEAMAAIKEMQEKAKPKVVQLGA
jgi:hypothetical protein